MSGLDGGQSEIIFVMRRFHRDLSEDLVCLFRLADPSAGLSYVEVILRNRKPYTRKYFEITQITQNTLKLLKLLKILKYLRTRHPQE